MNFVSTGPATQYNLKVRNGKNPLINDSGRDGINGSSPQTGKFVLRAQDIARRKSQLPAQNTNFPVWGQADLISIIVTLEVQE